MTGLIRSTPQIFLITLALLIAGCSAGRADPTTVPNQPATASPELPAVDPSQAGSLPTNSPLETTPASPASRELLHINGNGAPLISAPLQLAQLVTLRAYWEQTSQGEFSFGLAAANSESAATPYEVIFELILGPSTGSGEAEFPAGTYVVQVTAADGPWSIWIETVDDP